MKLCDTNLWDRRNTRAQSRACLPVMFRSCGMYSGSSGLQVHSVGLGIHQDWLLYVQVIDELDRSPYSRLLKYVATDVSASWGAALLKSLNVPALDFKVTSRPSRPLNCCILVWNSNWNPNRIYWSAVCCSKARGGSRVTQPKACHSSSGIIIVTRYFCQKR